MKKDDDAASFVNPSVHPFDAATNVRRDNDGRFTARVSRDYWAFVGPFGGVTAATLLRALMQHPDRRGEPLALTVNLAAPLEAGECRLEPRCARSNRSTQHWNIELLQGDDPSPQATATAIFAERRESWSHHSADPPVIRPQDQVKVLKSGTDYPWVSRYRFQFDCGAPTRSAEPLATPASAQSLLWLTDVPERPIDFLSLAAMGDAFFARIFQVRGVIVPFGTVSLTTYFQTDAAELASLPGYSLIGRVDARRFHRSYADQTGELWSPAGQLLATTHQIAYFKS